MDACKLAFFNTLTLENIMLTLIRMSNTYLDTCTMDAQLLNPCNWLGYLRMLASSHSLIPQLRKI